MREQGPLRHLVTENSVCAHVKEDKAGRHQTVEILLDSSVNAAIYCGGCGKADLIPAGNPSWQQGKNIEEQTQRIR